VAGQAFSDAENAPENDAFSATAMAGGVLCDKGNSTQHMPPVFCVRKRRGKCAIFRPGANVPQKARMPRSLTAGRHHQTGCVFRVRFRP
jgi:hypothetical protein